MEALFEKFEEYWRSTSEVIIYSYLLYDLRASVTKRDLLLALGALLRRRLVEPVDAALIHILPDLFHEHRKDYEKQ